MVHRNHIRARLALALAVCAGGAAASCRPALEQSTSAISLPALLADAADSSRDDGHWPMWRGSGAAGVAQQTELPTRWTADEGLRFKTSLPGTGNSSPVVWDDRIWLTAAVDTAGGAELTVLSIDRGDGHVDWQAAVGTAEGATHVKNGYASASVATDGTRLVASFGSAGLFAFDLQGQPLWRTMLGPLEHIWGSASSPLIHGDLVIQLADSQHDSYLAAYNKHTGDLVWRTPRESTGCWTTPILVEAPPESDAPGRLELVVNGTGTSDGSHGWVIAYDPADGRELWRVRGTTDIVSPTAVAAAGLVFSTSGRNGPTLAIRPGGSGDVTDTHVVWRANRGAAYVPSPVAYRNRLYAVNDGGVLTCYNVGNGEQIWRSRLKGNFTASLVAGDSKVYAANERGTIFVVAADDEFRLLAENELGERILATPALVGGELLVRTDRHLYAIAGIAAPDTVATSNQAEQESPPVEGGAAELESPADSPPAALAADGDTPGVTTDALPATEPLAAEPSGAAPLGATATEAFSLPVDGNGAALEAPGGAATDAPGGAATATTLSTTGGAVAE